jgi:hypothetical protein
MVIWGRLLYLEYNVKEMPEVFLEVEQLAHAEHIEDVGYSILILYEGCNQSEYAHSAVLYHAIVYLLILLERLMLMVSLLFTSFALLYFLFAYTLALFILLMHLFETLLSKCFDVRRHSVVSFGCSVHLF